MVGRRISSDELKSSGRATEYIPPGILFRAHPPQFLSDHAAAAQVSTVRRQTQTVPARDSESPFTVGRSSFSLSTLDSSSTLFLGISSVAARRKWGSVRGQGPYREHDFLTGRTGKT